MSFSPQSAANKKRPASFQDENPSKLRRVDTSTPSRISADVPSTEFKSYGEGDDLVHCAVIWNAEHGISRQDAMDLISLKCVFARQLPKMPREYIARLIMDRRHRSLCIKKKAKDSEQERIIGGVCFRPFDEQKFAEIVFLAVSSDEQVKGYGSKLMNYLKEYVKNQGIRHFLTYADNYAIGYFKKQGFTKNITMPEEQWHGFIKDYDGGTLMQCDINPKINYLDVKQMIKEQRAAVMEKMKEISKSHIVRPGLSLWSGTTNQDREPIPIESIPGVAEAGWKQTSKRSSSRLHGSVKPSPVTDLTAHLGMLMKAIRAMEESWPFHFPVDKNEVPDYYDQVKHPMDLKTISNKLDEWEYKTPQAFRHDMMLIFSNCRDYNDPDSVYVKYANKCEAKFVELMDALERRLALEESMRTE